MIPHNKKLNLLILFLSLVMVSCLKHQEDTMFDKLLLTQQRNFSANLPIPYADSCDLALYSTLDSYLNYGVLDYKLARDLAFVELVRDIEIYYPSQVIQDLLLPHVAAYPDSLSLSDRPVVVYDYADKPYYYEFSVLFGLNRIGTVTVCAQPRGYELIEFMFPSPIEYSACDCNYRRYVGEYPDVYYKRFTNYEKIEYIDSTDVIFHPIYFTPTIDRSELIQELKNCLSANEWSQINDDIRELANIVPKEFSYSDLNSYLEPDNRDSVDKYWNSECASVPVRNDAFQISSDLLNRIQTNIDDINTSVVGFLDEYMDDRLRLTQWWDYCGPAILSWMYRGKNPSFNGTYLKVYGDGVDTTNYRDYYESSNYAYYKIGDYDGWPNTSKTRETMSLRTDGGLYYTFFKYCTPTAGTYPLYDSGIRAGVNEATNGDYGIKFIVAPVSWLEDKREPVLVEGIGGHPHYWAAIGYGYNVSRIGAHKNWKIFVTDNGSYNYKHNRYPYWSNLGGLNYGWKRN